MHAWCSGDSSGGSPTQQAVRTVQYTVWQYTAYTARCTVHSTWYTACRILRAYSVRCTVHSAQHASCSTRCAVCVGYHGVLVGVKARLVLGRFERRLADTVCSMRCAVHSVQYTAHSI